MQMKIHQLFSILLFFIGFDTIHAQIVVQPSFSVGKSAFYFFGKEPISVGQFNLKDDDYGRTPLLDYRFRLFFPEQKFGIQFNRAKFFEYGAAIKKSVYELKQGDFFSRKFRATELLIVFQIKNTQKWNFSLLNGVCFREGFETRFGKYTDAERDLITDVGYYKSYGISNRVETKFRPTSWFFISADVGLQTYFNQKKSYIFKYDTPRFHFVSGLSIGTEFNLKFKKRK
jgi:hypothetical protein